MTAKRTLTPAQVLSILLERMDKRANALEGVKMEGYNMAVIELRRFASMLKSARDYVDQHSSD